MQIEIAPTSIKKLLTSWRFQQTVQISDSSRFSELVSRIALSLGPVESATVIVDQVVFDSAHLSSLSSPDNSNTPLMKGSSVTTTDAAELAPLLHAALSDNLDFLFFSSPKPFVFYSDHDEWTTFYANTRSNLNHIIHPLQTLGFKLIDDWVRKL